MQQRVSLVLLLVLLVSFRLLGALWPDQLANFQPLTAVFFCTMVFLGWRALWVPALAWLVTLPLTNGLLGFGWSAQMGVALLGLVLTVGVGWLFRNQARSLVPLLGGAALCAVLAYFVMNCFSWLTLPDYPKNLAGFVQAQWTGAPHHALPTWVFLRNPLLANVLFTGLFVMGQYRFGALSAPAGRVVPTGR
jgi:hypothetical protein